MLFSRPEKGAEYCNGMPRYKMTPEIGDAMFAAYTEWDPYAPGAPSIEEVCAPFDISKATFYKEMLERNLPLKSEQRRARRVVVHR